MSELILPAAALLSTIMLAALKLFGMIEASWTLVFSPALAWLVLVASAIVLLAVLDRGQAASDVEW